MAHSKHADLVYDVGMNRGEDTEFYAKKGYQVVGFESDPLLVDQCRKRFVAELAGGQLNIVAGVIAARTTSRARSLRSGLSETGSSGAALR